MSKRSDWMPGTRTGQLEMAKIWYNMTGGNTTAWGIPTTERTALKNTTDEAESALNEVLETGRTPAATAVVIEAFKKLKSLMRQMKARRFLSPPLTDPDLVSLGLRPRDTVRTPVSDPTGQAEADITYPGPHLLMLHMKPLAGTLLDPRADHGYRIYYGILPAGGATVEEATGHLRYMMKAAELGDDLPNSRFTRRRKMLFEFPEIDSGKTCFFAIRYENARGHAGPWGPVFSAIIP